MQQPVSPNDYLKDLTEIRSMMERSSRFISLSGLSGVFAGVYALIGAAWAHWLFNSQLPAKQLITSLLVDAALVLTLAIGTGFALAARNAKRKGHKIWDKTAQRLVVALFLPVLVGGIFCLALLVNGAGNLLASAMLIFYGMGLVNASKYTFGDIYLLGILEMAFGLIAAFLPGSGLLFWSIGFGLLHILYGIIMYRKYEQ